MKKWVTTVDPRRAAEIRYEHAGLCDVCYSPEPGGKGTWNVDHCHVTNRIRGVVCFDCNVRVIPVAEKFFFDPGLEVSVKRHLRRAWEPDLSDAQRFYYES